MGFRTSSISTCARMPPHMPAVARGEESCGFVEPASAQRPNRASERAASKVGGVQHRLLEIDLLLVLIMPVILAVTEADRYFSTSSGGFARPWPLASRTTSKFPLRIASNQGGPSGTTRCVTCSPLVDIAVQQLETETLRSGLFQETPPLRP